MENVRVDGVGNDAEPRLDTVALDCVLQVLVDRADERGPAERDPGAAKRSRGQHPAGPLARVLGDHHRSPQDHAGQQGGPAHAVYVGVKDVDPGSLPGESARDGEHAQ